MTTSVLPPFYGSQCIIDHTSLHQHHSISVVYFTNNVVFMIRVYNS